MDELDKLRARLIEVESMHSAELRVSESLRQQNEFLKNIILCFIQNNHSNGKA